MGGRSNSLRRSSAMHLRTDLGLVVFRWRDHFHFPFRGFPADTQRPIMSVMFPLDRRFCLILRGFARMTSIHAFHLPVPRSPDHSESRIPDGSVRTMPHQTLDVDQTGFTNMTQDVSTAMTVANNRPTKNSSQRIRSQWFRRSETWTKMSMK